MEASCLKIDSILASALAQVNYQLHKQTTTRYNNIMTSHPLIFLHTAAVHVNTFEQLLADAPTKVSRQHIVRPELLDEARQTGLTPTLQEKITAVLTQATAGKTAVCLCTCSTIGALAEQVGQTSPHLTVIRVDRPMAKKAIATGARIIVMATVQSTLEPTTTLLQSEANKAGKNVTLIEVLCQGAWSYFEANDQEGYLQNIAAHLQQYAQQGDVIVLAQASMANAVNHCPPLPIPILSSPALGIEAALNKANQ